MNRKEKPSEKSYWVTERGETASPFDACARKRDGIIVLIIMSNTHMCDMTWTHIHTPNYQIARMHVDPVLYTNIEYSRRIE